MGRDGARAPDARPATPPGGDTGGNTHVHTAACNHTASSGLGEYTFLVAGIPAGGGAAALAGNGPPADAPDQTSPMALAESVFAAETTNTVSSSSTTSTTVASPTYTVTPKFHVYDYDRINDTGGKTAFGVTIEGLARMTYKTDTTITSCSTNDSSGKAGVGRMASVTSTTSKDCDIGCRVTAKYTYEDMQRDIAYGVAVSADIMFSDFETVPRWEAGLFLEF
jgi:hypothetical protein